MAFFWLILCVVSPTLVESMSMETIGVSLALLQRGIVNRIDAYEHLETQYQSEINMWEHGDIFSEFGLLDQIDAALVPRQVAIIEALVKHDQEYELKHEDDDMDPFEMYTFRLRWIAASRRRRFCEKYKSDETDYPTYDIAVTRFLLPVYLEEIQNTITQLNELSMAVLDEESMLIQRRLANMTDHRIETKSISVSAAHAMLDLLELESMDRTTTLIRAQSKYSEQDIEYDQCLLKILSVQRRICLLKEYVQAQERSEL